VSRATGGPGCDPAPVPAAEEQLRVAVLVPNWNGAHWLSACLDSVAVQTRPADEVLVVDNGSGDGSLELLRRHYPHVRVIAHEHNLGFAAAANRGLAETTADAVALINTDVVLDPSWLERTEVALVADRRCASVACKMVDMEDPGRVYDAGDVLRRDGVCEQRGRFGLADGRFDEPEEIFGACAGAALYRREAVLAVGGFDERLFAYLEDVELALRLGLAGWRCRYEPVIARHAGGGSSGQLRRPVAAWVERNTLLIVARSFPVRWLGLVAYRQLGWVWHAWREGHLIAHLRGAAAALPLLPRMLSERRELRRSATVPIEQVIPRRSIRDREFRDSDRSRSAPLGRGLQPTLFLAAAALAGFTVLRGVSPHDEGLMLAAGQRVAAGQWPYRDFWTNYGPGQPVLIGGLTSLLGPSLLAWRILRVALAATISVLAFRLVRREAPLALALLSWLAVAGVMAFPSEAGPNAAALTLGLAALLNARSSPRAAGVLVALTGVFRPELGLGALIGCWLAHDAGRRGRLTLTAWGVGGTAVMMAPFALIAPSALASDLIGFLGIQHLQRLPLPVDFQGPLRPSKLIEFYMPVLLLAGLALWGVAAVMRRPDRLALAPLPLALVGMGYLLGRPDEFHLLLLAVPLAVLLGVAAARASPGLRSALVAALAVIAAYGVERRAGQALHPPAQAAVPGAVGDGVRTDPADARALGALIAYVHDRIPVGSPIWVANPRHDLVRAGNPLLYVILQRPNPTRYDVMQPGLITTATVQREIVGDLRRRRPRLVVRWLDPRASSPEPDGAGRSSGVRVLDDYLASSYTPAMRVGAYEVLRRSATAR
jgi:GT2 family glycosyltransferase